MIENENKLKNKLKKRIKINKIIKTNLVQYFSK